MPPKPRVDTTGVLARTENQPPPAPRGEGEAPRVARIQPVTPADTPTNWSRPLPKLNDPAGILKWAQEGVRREPIAVLTIDPETGRMGA
jgi:hypothetical protein